jgi:DNA polymerase-1
MTPTGKLSTSKDALLAALPDLRIKGLLVYRSAIEKSLSTYMRPWLAQGKNLHCNWNQVRDYEDRGARTGRLSSSPNLQNLTNPEKYEEVWALMERCKCAFEGFTFPNLRRYLVAPKGMELFSHDYSQQEFRMLAHYEGGVLAERYREDPDADMHETVSGIIKDATGVKIERKPTKTINFGKVYGMGAPKLAAQLGVSVDEAYALLAAYDTALPSVKGLMRECIGIGQRGESIRTLGGRRYYAPPPEYICEGWNDMLADLDLDARVWRDKYDMPESKKVRLPLSRAARLAHYRKLGAEIRTYEYKLLNYLIQGSSADQTKEAMRLWWREIKGTDTRFLLTVHDQLVGCAPKQKVSKASLVLGECMEQAFKLDVPVKTDATYGTNFGEMK